MDKNQIYVTIRGERMVALVDSGKHISCISRDYARKLILQCLQSKNEQFLELHSVAGQPLEIVDQAEISISIERLVMKI